MTNYNNRDIDKDETFLILKHGEHYTARIIEKWHDSDEPLTEAENRICYNYLRKLAGIITEEKKAANEFERQTRNVSSTKRR